MDVLKFTLSGKQAMFKKPDVNSVHYYTYGHIHKPALLGLLGAILGYSGYAGMCCTDVYPEYYQNLKDIHVSIRPNADKGYFSKKIICFNNSVGYASRETGCNLIVKEQWIEDPSWDIFVMLDCDEAEKIAVHVMEKKCVYVPYLGKNDHFADIGHVGIGKGFLCHDVMTLDCLFPKDSAVIDTDAALFCGTEHSFKYEESLPIGLDPDINQYVLSKFVYTNMPLCDIHDSVYSVDGKQIVFY